MQLLSIILNPGIVKLVALLSSVTWMLRDQRDRTRPLVVFAFVLYLFFGTLLSFFMGREGALFPWKYDHVLFGVDASLGVSAAELARQFQPTWRLPIMLIYDLMLPMMILWLLVNRHSGCRTSVIHAYVIELVLGPVMYAVVPACGPIYAFGPGWLHPPAVPVSPVQLSGFPNAFPSLHMGTAMVFVLFAPTRFWREVSLVFLTGTAIATLASGEHYVIDLVPGLAFGCFASLAALRRRATSALFLGLLIGWSLGVRFVYGFLIAYPGVTGSFAVVTALLAALAVVKVWTVPQLRLAGVTTANSGAIFSESAYANSECSSSLAASKIAPEGQISKTSSSSVREARMIPEGSSTTE